MSLIDLPFTRTEYESRLLRVRAAMEHAGLELLFVADPSNMHWLSAYDGWSFYVHQGLLVPLEGEPVYWGRAMDAIGATKTCWMSYENIVGYPDHFVQSTERHPMSHLAELIAERGWTEARLGVEMENYYYSAKAHAVLTAEMGRPPDDATGLVNWCRVVKSPAELGFIRRAARIVEHMHERIWEVFEPGVRKNDVVAEIYRAGIAGAEDEDGRYGGDYAAICPLLPTGEEAAAAHLTWNDRPVPDGSGTFFEIAGCYRRYHAPLSRTIWLGEPPIEVRRAEEAVLEGIEAGIDAARAGNVAGDVARAFYAVLGRHGIARAGRCGYSIGVSYPPDWGERTFSIRAEDETVLLPDMVFHFMPALWMHDWGLEITETLHLQHEGPAVPLANVERKLFVKA